MPVLLIKYRKTMMFLQVLTLLLSIISCDDPEVERDKALILDENSTRIDDDFQYLLMLNSLGETFSIASVKDGLSVLQKNIPLSPNPEEDGMPCMGPNQIKDFDSKLYIVCSLSNGIQIFDKKTLQLKDRVQLGNHSNPFLMEFISPELAVATGFVSDELIFFHPGSDTGGDKIVKRIDLSSLELDSKNKMGKAKPSGIYVSEHHVLVSLAHLNEDFVAAGHGYLLVVDKEKLEISELLKLPGKNSVNIRRHPDDEQKLYIVNAGTYQVEGGGYLGDGSLDIFNLNTLEAETSIAIDGAPFDIKFASDNQAYITNGHEGIVMVLDTAEDKITDQIDLRSVPCEHGKPQELSYISSAVVDSKFLYVTEFNSNCLMQIDRRSKKIISHGRTGDGPIDILVVDLKN